jgi:hypothetical protein
VSVEVQLVGGPADGVLLVIEGDPMQPPHTYELVSAVDGRPLAYRRTVNPGDTGPLWHYLFSERPVSSEEPST